MVATLVQSVSVSTNTASPLSITLGANTSQGNTLIVCSNGNAAVNDPSVTGITLGSASGNFAQNVTIGTPSTDFQTVSIWSDPNCTGGQTSVSVSFSTSGGSIAFCVTVMEWAGLLLAVPNSDKTAGQINNTNGTSWSSSATAGLSQSPELAIGIVGAYLSTGVGTINGPSPPWSNLTQKNSPGGTVGQLVGYQALSSTAAVTYSGTTANSVQYGAAIATFKVLASTDIPDVQPGPTWISLYKPGWKRTRPLATPSSEAVEQVIAFSVPLPALVTNIVGTVVHDGTLAIVLSPPVAGLNVAYESNFSVTQFAPGPTWLEYFKPGLQRARPTTPWQQITVEFGTLSIVIPPVLTTTLAAVQTNPADVTVFNPGPTWWTLFKPGLKQTRPYTTFDLKGESGRPVINLPTLSTSISAALMNFSDVQVANPGPTWLALFKPGIRKRPVEQDDRVAALMTGSVVIVLSPGCRVELEQGPLSIVIPTVSSQLQGIDYYGRLNPVISSLSLTTSLFGQTQQTEHGALAIVLPVLAATIACDNGRKLLPITAKIPTLIVSLSGVIVHNGIFTILFMNCGSGLRPLTRYEMFGCESVVDMAIVLSEPVLEISAYLTRVRTGNETANWLRAKRARSTRRRQIQAARTAAQGRQKLREDTDDG